MQQKELIKQIHEYLKYQKEISGNELFLKMPESTYELPVAINKHAGSTEENPSAEFTPQDGSSEPELIHQHIRKIEREEWATVKELDVLYSKIKECRNCPLGLTRKSFVFGTGNPNADIMIIGEAPGAEEDLQGAPFVGRAGQLLTKILESVNLTRDEVFIANIIKCRPPGNRNPLPSEVDECEPYLKKQIELINPEFILVLGLVAVNTLTKEKHKMGESRGKILNYENRKMLITYHPAALLRNPQWKRSTWEDVKLLRKMYDEYLESKNK